MPRDRKKRQSASFWFQRASVDSTRPAAASATSSWTMAISSVAAIAHLVFGRLAQRRHRARNPVGCPPDQLLGIDDWQAEQLDGLRRVGQPGRRLFLANDAWLAAKKFAKFRREIAHG